MNWGITGIGAAITIIAIGFLIMLICNHRWRKQMEWKTRMDLYQNAVPHWNKDAQQENFCAHCEHGITQYHKTGKLMRVDCELKGSCREFSRQRAQ